MEIIIDKSESMSVATGRGSMFRRVIEAARAAVAGRSSLPDGTDLAWRVAGGANPDGESACDATRLLVPAGISADPIFAVALSEHASGPRPLTAALEAAVADMRQDGRQRSLLIVTQGDDTCGREVCETAADLRDSPGLGQVHVLLLGGDKRAAARLECLGPVTRISAEELEGAIEEAIDSLAHPARVSVMASAGGRDAPARAELFAQTDARPAATARQGEQFRVIPGIYQVHVTRPASEDEVLAPAQREGWRRNVEIVAGADLVIRVPMGIQQANIAADVQFNGGTAPPGTHITVFPAGETDAAVAGGAPGESLMVPEGRYDIRAQIPNGPDTFEIWKPEVSVNPGQTLKLALAAAQRRGTLEIDAFSGDTQLHDAQVTVFPSGRDAENAVVPAGQRVPLAAGTYTAIARVETAAGQLEGRTEVEIDPGIAAQQSVDVGSAGWLTVNVAGRRRTGDIVVALYRAGARHPVGHIETFGKYLLPAGSYDLRIEDAERADHVAWRRGVDVASGESKTVTVRRP